MERYILWCSARFYTWAFAFKCTLLIAINAIETSPQFLFDWFTDSFMKANGKSHLLMRDAETTHADVDGSMIKCTQKQILLGINLDSELKFEDHANFM